MLQDGILITTLERAVSADFNHDRDLAARSLAEVFRAFTKNPAMGGIPTWLGMTHIARGLFLQLSLGSPVMSTGILGQDVAANPPDVPTPDTFDSDYRFGLQLATEALTDPWAGVNMWYLLQARVVRVTTLSEVRDIYNPATLTFAPSAPIDKRRESQIEWAWKAGGAALIPAADAGYAPLAALYRPAGGGAIAINDIVQLSIQLDDVVSCFSDGYVNRRSCKRFRKHNATEAKFSLAGEIDGLRLYAHAETAWSLRTADFVDSAFAASMGTDGLWWYLYLAPGTNILPSNLYGTGLDHRGILIASRVNPTDLGRNRAALNAPAPISQVVAAGTAVFVGIFRADGGGAGIHNIDISENGEGLVDFSDFSGAVPGNKSYPMLQANGFLPGGSPLNLALNGPGGTTEDVPLGVVLRCFIEPLEIDIAATSMGASVEWALSGCDTVYTLVSFRGFDICHFELVPKESIPTVAITVTGRAAAMGPTAFGVAEIGTNWFHAGLYGVRF